MNGKIIFILNPLFGYDTIAMKNIEENETNFRKLAGFAFVKTLIEKSLSLIEFT